MVHTANLTFADAVKRSQSAEVFRVCLNTEEGTYRTRYDIRAVDAKQAAAIYQQILANPPAEYVTIELVADCRVKVRQMLHGDQEIIS